ncbi:MAG: hypothetical protein CSA95_02200 [Bacteroidetes bacterium]|nr:MAG: hypothetical protein CSA95_02200 [Bacteroidota bacterium]PIE88460.1 MAG: hypothetical protein CSA04_01790 [Bacteroidota bacterium]
MRRLSAVFVVLLFFVRVLWASDDGGERVIHWSSVRNDYGEEVYTFSKVFYDEENLLYPLYMDVFPGDRGGTFVEVEVEDPLFEEIPDTALLPSLEKEAIPEVFTFFTKRGVQRRVPVTSLIVNPFYRKDGVIYRLKRFSVRIHETKAVVAPIDTIFSETSVMAKGDWYSFFVRETGVHAITGADLQALGLDITQLDPSRIALFGSGGAMLPESNSDVRPPDLQQMAVMLEGVEDGRLDADDRIIFYAEGPLVWNYLERYRRYRHQQHYYSDKIGYYITVLEEPAKRIERLGSVSQEPTHVVHTCTRLLLHEKDERNLLKSGKAWVGHPFSAEDTTFSVMITVPDLDTSAYSYLRTRFIARSLDDEASYRLSCEGEELLNVRIPDIQLPSTSFAMAKRSIKSFKIKSSENVQLDYTFVPGNSGSQGWLDYLELHAVTYLRYRGESFVFRDLDSWGYQRVAQFNMVKNNHPIRIFDVTDFQNVHEILYSEVGDTARFTRPSTTLNEYVVFEDDDLLVPELGEKVGNQNLHAASPVDFLIISHPDFLASAERLGMIHESADGYSYSVVTPEEIYQEFSYGVQDITALRDFIRSLYLKSNGEKPRFVALMGDASYEYKDRIPFNTNFVPTFQSKVSFNHATSWVTDDYFGLMDRGEGGNAAGILDIGVGRFPVSTQEQAVQMVDKIDYYTSKHLENSGAWKNKIVFVADDADKNRHINQADILAERVDTTYSNMNVDKIYLDAYNRESFSGMYYYPEAKEDLINVVEQGVMVVNYTGHGGELGLTNEKVLEIPDINAWTNFQRMPVFITATCQFSRFDNPAHVSAGELLFLNPHGGAVSMLTTSRISFSDSNFQFNYRIYDIFLNSLPGENPTLGEVMCRAKMVEKTATKNFVILGDPALKLALPSLQVITEEVAVMGTPSVVGLQDTVRGLEHFSLKGYVADEQGQRKSDFNGSVNVRLFDKPSVYATYGHDMYSYVRDFELRDKLLFDGYADVVEGQFAIDVLIPKDINYQYGEGKISYYALDSTTLMSASGFYKDLVIGGFSEEHAEDHQGPVIRAYMNSKRFQSGDKTIENPILIVELEDPCGVNCIGNGIGHDIIAYLNNDEEQIIELNDYFIPTPGTYNSGKIVYPFSKLEEGKYTLTLKAWDMCNNSTVHTLDFVVSANIDVFIDGVVASPNPLEEYTEISFSHNMPGRKLDVVWEIFDIFGRRVYQSVSSSYCESTHFGPLRWNRRDYTNARMRAGAYPYHIRVKSKDGLFTVSSGVLILK